jgi:hypothetical protein
MVNDRREWDQWYQALGDVFLPNQADFTTAKQSGRKRGKGNFENTHRIAARNFATTVDGLLKPKTTKWFSLGTDESLLDDNDVMLWLEEARDIMWRAIYSTPARFVQASSEVDYSLVVFGTGCLFMTPNRSRNGISFRSFHLRDVAIGENSFGQIDTASLSTRLTARQAIERFGAENVGEKTREALGKKGREAEFEFAQLILPREDRDSRSLSNKDMPWASIIIDVESEHKVSESGFQEFPAAIPRWDTSPREKYGRSPAMMAYADARTLQAIAKTLLLGGQRAVDPPTWVMNDAVASAVRSYPGGVTVLDAQSAAGSRGAPIGVLDMGKNIPLGREIQRDYRELVQASFFNDLFINSVENRNLTATEVLERKEELVRVLGPTFGRLEGDYIGVIVERVFNMLDRMGAFPEKPEALEEAGIVFTYMSPIQQARKTTEAAGFSRTLEMLAPIIPAKPEILDNFDFDEITRDTPEWAGFPRKYLKSAEQVDAEREARAQQAQEAEQIAQAQQLAEAGRSAGLAEQAFSQAEG